MTVQQRILQLLEQRGWSKYKLAKESGLYLTTVYDWFNEKAFSPDRKSIEYVCSAFGITVAEFYSGVEENNLDQQQILLLQLFDKVPVDKRQIVFDLLRTLSQK